MFPLRVRALFVPKNLNQMRRCLCSIPGGSKKSVLTSKNVRPVGYTTHWPFLTSPFRQDSPFQLPWSNLRNYNTNIINEYEVSCDELREDVANDEKMYIIDVREPMEVEFDGKIPGSVLIPAGEIEDALRLPDEAFEKVYGYPKPPEDGEDVVVYCAAGVRSLRATLLLRSLGYEETRSLAGGIKAWYETNSE
ncbi:thiosulfate:glutathione sulfurtransferase-like isoform X1 [Clytia hemisphaerica]|uniref:Rhodanese domain-containing protein n=1 Tax=Clytia hemisphaerica TaxID=252671 RepID=A0A7M5V873_9CNID